MTLQFKLHQPADLVFNYLTDMQKFVSVHPVITKIEQTKDGNYLVYETLKFGFLPFSFTYSAAVEGNFEAKTVVIRATVMKITKIEMHFVIKAEKDGSTNIEETIHFKSPLPIKWLMQRIFKTQHEQLFKNIGTLPR